MDNCIETARDSHPLADGQPISMREGTRIECRGKGGRNDPAPEAGVGSPRPDMSTSPIRNSEAGASEGPLQDPHHAARENEGSVSNTVTTPDW